MDGWKNGRMDGWIDGWMDGWIFFHLNKFSLSVEQHARMTWEEKFMCICIIFESQYIQS